MSESPTFILNGETFALDGDPTGSLLRWLKQRRLNGTKEGCADGDCGACTVALLEPDGAGTARYVAVNSCLLPLGALAGREVITVEHLAEGDRLHPVQRALVENAGSQCGYCTPGFVMSLFVGLHEGGLDDHAISGNLCRCTGYAPIRRATAHLVQEAPVDTRFAECRSAPRAPLAAARLGSFHSPSRLADALALKAADPESIWFAGGTDVGVDFSRGRARASTVIALDRIAELQRLDISEHAVRIGAGLTLSDLQAALSGMFPALDQMLEWFAGRQVRNRATLGGNLGSASPIGDLLPVLLALDASIHLRGMQGERTLAAEDFFLDYRQTARRGDELIEAVTLPRRSDLLTASAKVAKRQTDDISIVAASFALGLDPAGVVHHARLAFGGVAAIPRRARAAEALLQGRRLDADVIDAAAISLRDEFSPLSDHRGGSVYRRALCANLFLRFIAGCTP